MRFSVSRRSPPAVAAVCVVLFFLIAGCSYFTKKAPEAELLEHRTARLIAVGWQWLHAENVILMGGRWQGEAYVATFQYEIVVDAFEQALSEFEKKRFADYLPMCASMQLRPGSRCPLSESIVFVDTAEYGWMPDIAVRFMQGKLAEIARSAGGKNQNETF